MHKYYYKLHREVVQMLSYIKEYYLLGLYTESNLDVFVNTRWITEEQKQEIIASKATQ